MKQLQNNFTTPEQSKRLLELELPADSADCVYDCALIGGEKYYSLSILDDTLFSVHKRIWEDPCTDIIPCWSVGRLIEIIGICHQPILTEMRIDTSNIIEYLLDIFDSITDGSGFDFLKLDE